MTTTSTYELQSRVQMQAAIRQYMIDSDAPVRLTLHGSKSYCYLKGIENAKLKETLAKVGNEFEKEQDNTFYNFSHTFTSTKEQSGKYPDDYLAKCIFTFINEAIDSQTEGKLALDLADMNKLVVNKAEDRSFMFGPHTTYELNIEVSESAIEAAQKSGLVFRDFCSSLPEGTRGYALGVGQRDIGV